MKECIFGLFLFKKLNHVAGKGEFKKENGEEISQTEILREGGEFVTLARRRENSFN